MSNCVYCKTCIGDDRAVDVCDMCGRKVWGDKMFSAIKENMGGARNRGDLEQGSINMGCAPKVGLE